MPFEPTEQDGELTLLSCLFLQVSGGLAWGLMRSLSRMGGRGNDFSQICLRSGGATHPSHAQEDPHRTGSNLVPPQGYPNPLPVVSLLQGSPLYLAGSPLWVLRRMWWQLL